VNDAPIICPNCGAKTSAGRTRCPRCRGELAPAEAAVDSRRSQRLLGITVGIVLVFAAVLFFLWYSGRPEPSVRTPHNTGTAGPGPAGSASLEPEFLEWHPAASASAAELLAAMEQQRAAVRANPEDASLLSDLGRTQLEAGQNAGAVGSLQAAAAASPASSEYRFLLARAQCALARWDECITSLREAQRLAPEELPIVHNLAVALHRRGIDDVAVEEFKRAQEISESEPAVRLGLGVSQDRLGNVAEAIAAYQEFLRLDPLSPQGPRVKARIAELGG
jgi:tetratricopeptide (TPR) repeat protein